jgi:hypothetical protein
MLSFSDEIINENALYSGLNKYASLLIHGQTSRKLLGCNVVYFRERPEFSEEHIASIFRVKE